MFNFFKIYTPVNPENQAVIYILKEQNYAREALQPQIDSVILDKKRRQQEGRNILIDDTERSLQLDKIP